MISLIVENVNISTGHRGRQMVVVALSLLAVDYFTYQGDMNNYYKDLLSRQTENVSYFNKNSHQIREGNGVKRCPLSIMRGSILYKGCLR